MFCNSKQLTTVLWVLIPSFSLSHLQGVRKLYCTFREAVGLFTWSSWRYFVWPEDLSNINRIFWAVTWIALESITDLSHDRYIEFNGLRGRVNSIDTVVDGFIESDRLDAIEDGKEVDLD